MKTGPPNGTARSANPNSGRFHISAGGVNGELLHLPAYGLWLNPLGLRMFRALGNGARLDSDGRRGNHCGRAGRGWKEATGIVTASGGRRAGG